MEADGNSRNNNGPPNSKRLKKMEEQDKMIKGSLSSPSGKRDAHSLLLHEFFRLGKSSGEKRKTAVIHDNGKGRVETLSYEQLDQGAEIVKKALERSFASGKCEGSNFVGVKCDMGRLYPILVVGILRSGSAFYNVDPDRQEASLKDGVKYLGIKYLLSDVTWRDVGGQLIKVEKIMIEGCVDSQGIPLAFQLHKVCGDLAEQVVEKVNISKKEDFAYAIQTSGTTGRKKTVVVPHSCICPNIQDFCSSRLWNVTPNDVIFGSAPPTFDPHIVELFAALSAGASILYTSPHVKQNGGLLANLLSIHQVTILQITPSLFRRLSCSLVSMRRALRCPLNKELCLRLITLGGEKCPKKEELLQLQAHIPLLAFQNVYGVTEVSCWASLLTIDLTSTDPITIGQGLLGTEITLNSAGEIVIMSSSRQCVIIDPASSESPLVFQSGQQYKTGDFGRCTSSGIVFEGRMDGQVKRNGMKISLYQIEAITLSTGLVNYAECKLHNDGKIYLMVTLKSEYSTAGAEGQRLLASKLELPLFMYPDYIIALDDTKIPLNGNGKVDFQSVRNSFHANLKSAANTKPILLGVTTQQIIETLTPIWKSCTLPVGRESRTGYDKVLLQQNFTASGGTSISAARFVESAFMALNMFGTELHRKLEQSLLQCLLSVEGDFEGVVQVISSSCNLSRQMLSATIASGWDVDVDMLPESQDKLPLLSFSLPTHSQFEFNQMDSKEDDSCSIFTQIQELPPSSSENSLFIRMPPEAEKNFHFALGLCVDASPAIIPSKNLVMIGCHGGVLLSIDLNILRQSPPKESHLAVMWKRKLPNRIEATVEIHPNSLYAFVGCHDGRFYKFSVSTGEILCWTFGGGEDAPIRSKCVITNDPDDDVVIIFVDSANSIYCVDAQALNVKWTVTCFKLLATVSPVTWRGRCYLATLDKGIACLDISTGATLWTSCANNNGLSCNSLIYSTPTLAFRKKADGRKRSPRLICGFKEGVEVMDLKSGALHWRQMSSCTSSQPPPLLLHNYCCDNLIWTECHYKDARKEGYYLLVKILEVDTGSTLQTFLVPHFDGGAPAEIITPSIVSYQTVCEEEGSVGGIGKQACFLFYKSSTLAKRKAGGEQKIMCPQLIFASLHGTKVVAGGEWEDKKTSWHPVVMENTPDFESFSKPVCCGEFILFGGRDNNLHVIQLKVGKK